MHGLSVAVGITMPAAIEGAIGAFLTVATELLISVVQILRGLCETRSIRLSPFRMQHIGCLANTRVSEAVQIPCLRLT
jgi:hypothetical protein